MLQMPPLIIAALALTLISCASNIDGKKTLQSTAEIRDADSDGYDSIQDCNDNDVTVHPSAEEVCDNKDNDCDGEIDEEVMQTTYIDEDGDGFGDEAIENCEPEDSSVEMGGDCDDADPSVFPGAEEICDNKDNNCDGISDDSLDLNWYMDADQDGYGDSSNPAGCDSSESVSLNPDDCNDNDDAIHPSAQEICDEIDNNCNNAIDEGVTFTYYQDDDQDGFGNPSVVQDACEAPEGYVAIGTDCNDWNTEINPAAPEYCDYIDNNCNELIDESGSTTLWYQDADNDGFGDPNVVSDACSQPDYFVENGDDCDDANPLIHPDAIEICNGQDTNCNGVVDDASGGLIWYRDQDGDNHGINSDTLSQCAQPSGYVLTDGDCNDSDPAINPAAIEICNEVDDDCNNLIDDGLVIPTWELDLDNDGYGVPGFSIESCVMPPGYADNSDDCDDSCDWIYPGAPEICNFIDDDCDGINDNGLAVSDWYSDNDLDGYGDPNVTVSACMVPPGYTSNANDCDDSNFDINPNQPEVCNGIDDNCDGLIDIGVIDLNLYYLDNDGDGHGEPGYFIEACEPPIGYAETNDDCDDSDPTIHPGADEYCDGVDSNCDGNNGFWESDIDNDGFLACEKALWIQNSTDSYPSPYNSYYQLSEMLRMGQNVEWDLIERQYTTIDAGLLENYGLIIHYGNNQYFGQLSTYSPSESMDIENFISDGGRLLYIGWHANNYGCATIDSMPSSLGVSCTNSWNDWTGHTTQFVNHPITQGLNGAIGGLGGDNWTVASPAETVASIWDNNIHYPFVIASELGHGRAVFVADEWPFYNDYYGGVYHIGYGDNEALVENILNWLTAP